MIHSFLMIGQSNMAGRGAIDEVPPICNPELRVLRNGRWQPFFTPVNPDRPFSGISLAESFADAYQRDHGVTVGLIPCADGGTQLEQWKPGSLLFDHAVYQARLAERTSNIAGILWHQGESDCKSGLCETYLERLNRFYDALTCALRLQDVPFIVGGLGDFLARLPEEGAYFDTVNRQLRAFADSHPRVGFASARQLAGKPDNLHFTAAAQRAFGLRYYEAFLPLEDKNRRFVEKSREDDALRTAIDGL